MLVLEDVVKVYPGPVTALAGVNLEVPTGMFGVARSQRRRQVDLDAHRGGSARAHLGSGHLGW